MQGKTDVFDSPTDLVAGFAATSTRHFSHILLAPALDQAAGFLAESRPSVDGQVKEILLSEYKKRELYRP